MAGDHPAYLGIARAIREGIVGGRYPVGSHLPTEQQLAAEFGVSRNTIRESLRKLREERLVKSRRGSGTRVLPPQSGDSNFLHAISLNDFQSYSQSWDFAMQVVQTSRLTPDLATWTGCPPDEDWLSIRCVSRTAARSRRSIRSITPSSANR